MEVNAAVPFGMPQPAGPLYPSVCQEGFPSPEEQPEPVAPAASFQAVCCAVAPSADR